MKMSLTSPEGYTNAGVSHLVIKKTNELWVIMKDVGDGLGVKSIFDLVLKEIHGICRKKDLTKEEIKRYKMTEREISKTFVKLSEDKLNTKSNKNVFVKNTIMTNIIKHCRGEKRGIRAIDGLRKKLFIPDYEISVAMEHVVKPKIGTYLKTKKYLKNILLGFIKLIVIFMSITKTIQVDNNDKEYILFRIDIYFTEYSLVVEIDEKVHTDRDLIFEQKKKKALEKKLNCTFIRINTSRENFDADYEASEIQTFISQFKDNKIKERDNKIKKLEDEIKKLKL